MTSIAGQSQEARDPSESILRLTTLIDVDFDDGTRNTGSGFFFQTLAPPDPNKTGPQWRAIKGTYVVTNRHVISPERFDHLQKLVFHLRRVRESGADWLPVEISHNELGTRLHLHPNSQVDVAAIDVLGLIQREIMSRIGPTGKGPVDVIPWSAVSADNFPGISRLQVRTGDDVLVVGYPRAIYDRFNKLPILKKAALITPWNERYEGWDAFLIDARLFEGSSGSIVVTRPTNLLLDKGQWLQSDTPQFLFLGVYSGEPDYAHRSTQNVPTSGTGESQSGIADLGVVWYYYNIEQATAAPAFRLRE